MIEKLVIQIVRQLVSQPEVVVVTSVESEGKCVVSIKVAPQDIARVIGSEGRIFRALRTIVTVMGAQQKRDVVLDIAR